MYFWNRVNYKLENKKKMEWSISGYYIRCCCIKWKDQIDNNLFTSEGDGRMDSPGHCAQFCSYTFMEYETKKILSIVTMDKRMTDKKSTVLEKACFLKGLRELLAKNLKVVEVVTDAHPQIESLMSKYFLNINVGFKYRWEKEKVLIFAYKE